MSFKSLLQDEFGSICSKVFGSRLKSQFVVDHSTSMEAIDDAEQSCWANMPPDLLKDILMRIEVSEPNWPSRKNVVSCAGVCRSWRKNMKEIVKCPQLSGKLTFPISLKQPGKLGSPIQCLIRRHPDHQIYYLYLHKKGDPYHKVKLLLAAKRVLKGPRQMRCEINTIHAISYSLSRNFNLTDDSQLWSLTDQNDVKLVLKNKTPKWHARLEHWSLNFNGRVNFASLNNFQLVSCLDNDARVKEHENIILQLGKYDDDDYLMDYQ
ncbi:hypothetical protein L1887_12599 [Cichorium endivia]|nr:hypothetical protein L1887_12599 [Cichorium endivia]